MDITNLLNSFAFPVVACVFLAWYLKEETKQNRDDTKESNKEHSKEMKTLKDEIKEAIDKNTTAVNTLCNIIKYNYSKEKGVDKNENE